MLKKTWIPYLESSETKFKLLFTIGIGRLSESELSTHPGTWARVIRASTHFNTHVTSTNGKEYPYWPLIAQWPELATSYSIEERRVNPISTQFSLFKTDFINSIVSKINKNIQGWVQIDLWTEGLTLEDSRCLASGPIRNITQNSESSTISISMNEGFDGDVPDFPLGNDKLEVGEFAGLPQEFDNNAPRRFIIGPLPNLLPCTPINQDRTEYYIAEPVLNPPPNEFFIGSNKINTVSEFNTLQPKVVASKTEISGAPFTKLVFDKRPQAAGEFGQVFVRGGSGPDAENVVSFFVDRIPKLKKTPRAKMFIQELNTSGTYDYFVILGSQGNPIRLLTDRILPQSNLIPFFRCGMLDIIKENDLSIEQSFVLGSNLEYRLDTDRARTDESRVFNAIDVKFSRRNLINQPGELYTRDAELVDKSIGGALGSLLARSEQTYGRRLLEVDAADLHVRNDAKRLGINLAQILQSVHSRWTYHMDWRNSFFLDLNNKGKLTDPYLNLTDTPVRVSRLKYKPNGIEVTFQSTDVQ